ncbi:malto-oligosyltrehalose synthase [uncultured Nitrospira sp.]|uniref:malto-oligosyltrehalose synthase n=1 Tax=uncultured Nitrospira sp. TaxID=157176 RepID=UPI003140690C
MNPLPLHIPLSTYRLQFNSSFTFQDASRILPYLSQLGITDCYASPYLKAVPGSTHGYDVVDPTELNPEIGTEAEYRAFIQALHQHGMGQILDVVPNHMGIAGSTNLWWQDVLENGPSSHYATFFDIDWTPVKPELENKVLLPILGDQYGIVLENQEIILHYDDGQFFLTYYENRLPVDPCTWSTILTFRQDTLNQSLENSDPHLHEYQSIITALSHLPARAETETERVAERYREKEVIRRRLSTVVTENLTIRNFLLENIRLLNGIKNSPRTFDVLDHLVSHQAYRLAYWRVAAEEINYRRFFDINQLAAIRMEEPEVFQAAHKKIFELLTSGAVNGLRIDHVDGLYNPRAFLAQWQQWAAEHLEVQADTKGRSLYLLVEKILGTEERLTSDWLCHGTTGYDYLALVNQLFIQETHQRQIEQIYSRFTKQSLRYDDLIYDSKNLIMTSSMSGEINALGHQLNVLSERNRRSRDFTLNSLIHAIREIIACFPVYRTYIGPDPLEGVLDRDRAYIRLAVARAKRRNPAISNLVFDFIRDLLLRIPQNSPDLDWEVIRPFVMKFQQTTSPVTAKGVEDTAFYSYNRLTSLNEVGGEPQHFGVRLSTFHQYMQDRATQWPSCLSSTSTHDTKRSEDVRARINVLSEIPTEWRQHLKIWNRLNKKFKQPINDQLAPSLNEEYLIYQTLLGTWPFGGLSDSTQPQFLARIQGYMVKALREAKVTTSWLNPDEAWERAVGEFLAHILSLRSSNSFLQDFIPFQQRIAKYGIYNSLSQVLIKTLAPGVPDFYQGTELWDFSLVDPDNRQPVDYLFRQQRLTELQDLQHTTAPPELVHTLLQDAENGLIKMYLTTTALHIRKSRPNLFLEGLYRPLEFKGEQAHHVCGFMRQISSHICVIIFPRLLTNLIPDQTISPVGEPIWGHTSMALPPELATYSFRNLLTQEIVAPQNDLSMVGLPLGTLFQHFPFALLEPVS